MNSLLPFEPVVQLLAPLLAGFGVGVLYFVSLRRSVTRFTSRAGWLEPVVLTVGRIAAAVGVLAVATRMGVVALLVTFAGFLLARTVEVYRCRRGG